MPRRSKRYSEDWEGATCAQIGAGEADRLFFPLGPNQAREAIAMCWDCPLRAACLIQALEEERGTPLPERFGVRGGLLPQQRQVLDPGKVCTDCGSPVITRSPRCDDDRETHERDTHRHYMKERRDAA